MQLTYALTIGPLGFIISSDLPSTKLRAKTLSLTATFQGMTYLVQTILGPYLLNPGAINAGAKMEFLFAGISVFSLIWSYFRLPEVSCEIFFFSDGFLKNEKKNEKTTDVWSFGGNVGLADQVNFRVDQRPWIRRAGLPFLTQRPHEAIQEIRSAH